MVRKGEHYEVVRELPVIAMTAWAAPCTGGYERVLRPGEEFVVSSNPGPWASAVYCDPHDRRRLERELIPRRDRWQIWAYRGFYLCIRLADIERCCERLAPAAGAIERPAPARAPQELPLETL